MRLSFLTGNYPIINYLNGRGIEYENPSCVLVVLFNGKGVELGILASIIDGAVFGMMMFYTNAGCKNASASYKLGYENFIVSSLFAKDS